MALEKESPFVCHIFICTFDRKDERESCADFESRVIRQSLKEEVAERGWKKHVRVSQCGCMGLCEDGPNVILHPQNVWFSKVTKEDTPRILAKVEAILKGSVK